MSGEAWEAEWERLLWKSKLYPDNYVPQSFLSSLSRNSNFKAYTYWYLVIASCAISQHLATIFTFLAIFVHLNERRLDPRILVWASVGGFVVGFLVWELLDCQSTISRNVNSNRAKTVKSSILVFLALMSLSPVLRTLTAATSSDSIWALSASLFTLNALLADYTALKHGGHHRERLSSVLSMNAAISSSVVLASRLSDDLSVFAVMLFSVQLFALFPMLRRRLQNSYIILRIFLTLVLCGSSLFLTASLSRTATCLFLASFAFVTFIAPGILVWAQRFKKYVIYQLKALLDRIQTSGSAAVRSEEPGIRQFRRSRARKCPHCEDFVVAVKVDPAGFCLQALNRMLSRQLVVMIKIAYHIYPEMRARCIIDLPQMVSQKLLVRSRI